MNMTITKGPGQEEEQEEEEEEGDDDMMAMGARMNMMKLKRS